MDLHPIPPGLWCVPSALVCLTGAPWDAVIHPALNRHGGESDLTDIVVGARLSVAVEVLDELGYRCRAYRGTNPHALVRTWAKLSKEKYPGHALFVRVVGHVLVVKDGLIYDNHSPHGAAGDKHTFSNTKSTHVYLVQPK